MCGAQTKPESELTSSLEDYLEAIYLLGQEHRVARVSHIAKRLGVNKSSVTGAIKHLAAMGYLDHDPYQFIRLNPTGEKVAKDIVRRHDIFKRFIVEVLGVDEDLAGETACKMEHHVDKRVLERLFEFLEFADQERQNETDWAVRFDRFRQRKQEPDQP